MKIIRYQDSRGNIGHGALQADGSALKLAGNIFDSPKLTNEKADMAKLLAPVQPVMIMCIGLNYRRHAQETNAKIPEFPVLFFKGLNTPQNPGDPILLPTHLKSNEVDYECELAVVIGKRCKNV
ncbi:MAG: fumarylacetoacetate hydrolase family protein, partial [Verrucomicrobia bacterium]|nr:fumarylacetoacetate hydrolase family protein [Verrucomicrobiota bacterium]